MRDVHTYFGLSYASHQVVPRVLAQSMPQDWQQRFVECMEELDAAFPDLATAPDYEVRTCEWTYVEDLSGAERDVLGIDLINDLDPADQVAVPVPDPLPHYRHGQVRPDLAAVTAVRRARGDQG